MVLDSQGRVLRVNPSLAEMLEYGTEPVHLAVVDVGDPDEVRAFEALTRGERDRYETGKSYAGRGGGELRVRVTATLLPGTDEVLGVVEDVTRLRDVEESLRESEQRFRSLMDNAVDAFFIHDFEGNILDCNKEACRSLGYSREELLSLGVKDFVVGLISDEERAASGGNTPWQRAMSGALGEIVSLRENEHRRKDGSTFPVEVVLSPMDYGGRRVIFATARDVSARKAAEEQLIHRAFHDSLTGLPNRALFMDRLEHALARQDRRGNSISLLFVDLDDFKTINDSWGHDAGDQVLVETGSRLSAGVRAGDTVARLAGDEFTVLLENVYTPEESEVVARRLTAKLREPFTISGRETFITASIGVMPALASGNARDLLERADQAMYRAKRGGKNRYEIHGVEPGG